MQKILALTAAAVLAVSSIGCTGNQGGSEPTPPVDNAAPADKAGPEGGAPVTPAPEGGVTPAPEGGAPAPAEGGAAPEGKAP
jgi:hypothetical protein